MVPEILGDESMRRAYEKPTFVMRDKLVEIAAAALPVSPSNQSVKAPSGDDVKTA
jgi:hypothetical protein